MFSTGKYINFSCNSIGVKSRVNVDPIQIHDFMGTVVDY